MADPALSLDIDRMSLLNAQTALRKIPKGIERVTVRAVNKTLTGVRTDSVREIQKVITPKASVIRKEISIQKATVARPSGRVESRGKPLGLAHYRARQTKKGVTVQVKKQNRRKLVKGAFMATPKGAKNVFWRYYHTGRPKPVRQGFPYGRLPAEYRLPVQRLTGPAIPDVMGDARVFNEIEKKAGLRLKTNFDHELSYMLRKL